MKNKMVLTEIIETAKTLDANQFAKFLDENKIEWDMLDCNIMDYNDGDFNITLDAYDDANIYFLNGQYFENQ
jgi:hypothetical protein